MKPSLIFPLIVIFLASFFAGVFVDRSMKGGEEQGKPTILDSAKVVPAGPGPIIGSSTTTVGIVDPDQYKFYITFPFNYRMGKDSLVVFANDRVQALCSIGATVWTEKEWKNAQVLWRRMKEGG